MATNFETEATTQAGAKSNTIASRLVSKTHNVNVGSPIKLKKLDTSSRLIQMQPSGVGYSNTAKNNHEESTLDD